MSYVMPPHDSSDRYLHEEHFATKQKVTKLSLSSRFNVFDDLDLCM